MQHLSNNPSPEIPPLHGRVHPLHPPPPKPNEKRDNSDHARSRCSTVQCHGMTSIFTNKKNVVAVVGLLSKNKSR